MRGSLKTCKAFSGSSWELSVEISVTTNPNPNPSVVWKSLRYGAVVPRHADRPEALVTAQSLKLERWMSGILLEFLVSRAGGDPDFLGQRPVELPEVACSSGGHGCFSKSLSLISGNCAGWVLNAASIWSPRAESAGRGRSSLMIRCQTRSPRNSGRMKGRSSASRSRSFGGNAFMAASISATVLMKSFALLSSATP